MRVGETPIGGPASVRLPTVVPSHTLSERDSKSLLAGYGIPIAAERVAGDPAAAGDAADELGYPVVAKLNGAAIAHKTERGLVRLNLGDRDAVAREQRLRVALRQRV